MQYLSLNGDDWKMKDFLGEDWVWRNAHKTETKDVRWWKPGTVPGSVLHDLYSCGEVPDPYYGKNSLLLEWVPERTWVYRKNFLLPEEMAGKQLKLCFQGVDYDTQIFLNDVLLGTHSGMFTAFSYDVTDVIRRGEENLLAVVINKAPDEQSQVSKTRYVKTHKSRMTYWWDFCPRMIHQGIWEDVYLEAYAHVRLEQVTLDTELYGGYSTARMEIMAEVEKSRVCPAMEAEFIVSVYFQGALLDQQEKPVRIYHERQQVPFQFELKEPQLWWPNGYGSQPLYEVKTEVYECSDDGNRVLSSEKTIRTGIREIRFEKNEGAEPDARAYTLAVNGQRIYMKGWNWVPMDVMYGVKHSKKLHHLLTLAMEAHVNILRIWGGGLIEREEFYQFCDENGILIWQEFIQSSSGIEDKPSEEEIFLKMMEAEAGQIILAKKNHPSLALWCGGNELRSGNHSMIRDTEPVIRVLQEQVQRLDRTRYFLPSSPTGRVFNNTLENIEKDPEGLHDVHGPWEHQGLAGQYELYNRGTALLSSEFGVEGMTNYQTLLRSMPEEFLWPPSRDNYYYFHRGSWWNNFPLVQELFEGKLERTWQVVMASQLMQYEGLKYAVESNRRRAMRSSGTFPWQFNEPYPNNTCTSAVDYYGRPKPAYYGVKKAYQETSVTAGFRSQSLMGSRDFAADIYVQTSGKEVCADVRVSIIDSKGTVCREEQFTVKEAVEQAVHAGMISCEVQEIGTDIFFLDMEAVIPGTTVMAANRYLFTKSTLAGLLEMERTQVSVKVKECGGDGNVPVMLHNTGQEVAVGLSLIPTSADTFIRFNDNYFYLLPGEIKEILVTNAGDSSISLKKSGFNLL